MLIAFLATSFLLLGLALVGPFSMLPLDFGGYLYLSLLVAHLTTLGVEFWRKHSTGERSNQYIVYEVLMVLWLFLFVFSWIYARNANMDYAQRIAAGSTAISFEQSSLIARIYALIRYIPLFSMAVYLFVKYSKGISLISRGATLFVALSVIVITLALPSFLSLEGIGGLAWIALVPLFFILRRSSYARGLWLIGVYAAFSTMLIHYWLGGFNLVALQGSTIIIIGYYIIFFSVGYFFLRRFRNPLFWAMVWTVFAFYRHYGFSAFPWGLLTHAQYNSPTLIQIADVTGIWGIEFVLVYCNAALAFCLDSVGSENITHKRSFSTVLHKMLSVQQWKSVGIGVSLIVGLLIYGSIQKSNPEQGEEKVRVALVQNNTDPRKKDYRETFSILKRETSVVLSENPDIVIWPETAIVPNIRRWSEENPEEFSYAAIIRDFIEYQRVIDTYLLTGNDDYVLELDDSGREIGRKNRNGAVLFSDQGERLDTYHKIRLVPFTEHFPYKDLLPGLHDYLLNFDVSYWEPGTEPTIFEHPKVSFGVMICFEDSFPDGGLLLAREGARMFVNIGNDYWAQDPVEAQQHLATAVFRSVEHRLPFVRSTTSGVTSIINMKGEILQTIDPYTTDSLVGDVFVQDEPSKTVYTRFGNWFAYTLIGGIAVYIGLGWLIKKKKKNG